MAAVAADCTAVKEVRVLHGYDRSRLVDEKPGAETGPSPTRTCSISTGAALRHRMLDLEIDQYNRARIGEEYPVQARPVNNDVTESATVNRQV
jgi:hypothetical protein